MESTTLKSAINSRTTMRRSWLALYAALLSAVVFADPASNDSAVPPVASDAEAPGLEVRSMVRRLEI